MLREEVKRVLMILQTSYPSFKVENKTEAVDIWHMMLEEYDTNLVMAALKAVIKDNRTGFAPSIGEIIAKVEVIAPKADNILNEQEAWLLVSKALRNSSYHAEEEFAKLPEMVKEAVGGAGNLRNWAQTDIESIENVIASNFQRTYRTIMKREKEVASLPTDARQMRDLLTKNDTYTTNLISDISEISEKGTD